LRENGESCIGFGNTALFPRKPDPGDDDGKGEEDADRVGEGGVMLFDKLVVGKIGRVVAENDGRFGMDDDEEEDDDEAKELLLF
jgi:hypothetical protein